MFRPGPRPGHIIRRQIHIGSLADCIGRGSDDDSAGRNVGIGSDNGDG